MKLILLTLSLLCCLPALASLPRYVQAKPEWKYVVTSEDDQSTWKTYYDAANIEHPSKNIVRVWLKQMPVATTNAEKQRMISAIIENRKDNEMRTDGYEKFAYSLTLVEFDCAGRQGRSMAIKDYDQSEKLLGSDTKDGVPFAPVREHSMSEAIMEAACK